MFGSNFFFLILFIFHYLKFLIQYCTVCLKVPKRVDFKYSHCKKRETMSGHGCVN